MCRFSTAQRVRAPNPQVVQGSTVLTFGLLCFRFLFPFKEVEPDYTPQCLFLYPHPVEVTTILNLSFTILMKNFTFIACAYIKK